jgi:hypothetical protein
MFKIQLASADGTNRFNNTINPRWQTVVEEETEYNALLELVGKLNNEDIVLTNSWLRIIRSNGEIINY